MKEVVAKKEMDDPQRKILDFSVYQINKDFSIVARNYQKKHLCIVIFRLLW